MPFALSDWIRVLELSAPPALAASWDNVGLLLDVMEPRPIERALLAIDYTSTVLDEAKREGAGLVIAYHPPIFAPLKRIRRSQPKERLVLETVSANLALYSPHTALDAVPGGVNDWLADGLGAGRRRTIEPASPGEAGAGAGQGRIVELETPTLLDDLLERIKRYLGLESLRVAVAGSHRRGERISSIALCPGAGGSVITGVEADLYLTGEMRHHDVLDAVARGTSVVLTEHSSSERGYLPIYRERLLALLPAGVSVDVSRADSEPLERR